MRTCGKCKRQISLNASCPRCGVGASNKTINLQTIVETWREYHVGTIVIVAVAVIVGIISCGLDAQPPYYSRAPVYEAAMQSLIITYQAKGFRVHYPYCGLDSAIEIVLSPITQNSADAPQKIGDDVYDQFTAIRARNDMSYGPDALVYVYSSTGRKLTYVNCTNRNSKP